MLRPAPLPVTFTFALAALVSCGRPRTFLTDASTPRDTRVTPDAAIWIECQPGQTRCMGESWQRCLPDGEFTTVQVDDCAAAGQVCMEGRGCVPCRPGQLSCTPDEATVLRCADDASGFTPVQDCDMVAGLFCRGGTCRTICDTDDVVGTNIGCEYYAADLDNAQLGAGESAASQQYAIVVSNPDPLHTARVRIEWNTAEQGQPPRPATVASAVIPPMDLEAFPLPAREVDCSAPGTFNTGTGTCLSSQAYHVVSTVPVIAFEFNPLQNRYAFSNDASLLLPTNSLQGEYTVMGWPQTLASSPPQTVLNPGDPVDLRGFVTIIGTMAGTHVHLVPRADVVPGGPFTTRGIANAPVDVTLGAFDILNIETDGFEADFTGTTVQADHPVAVFAGSECSDVPAWTDLNDRRCCCDHLESQQFPRNTVGQHYVAVHTPCSPG
ncbi:MAG: IgGFc-binding protein [Deltaproteobacteria bacterium]